MEDFDGVPVGLLVEVLLAFDAAIGVVVEDIALAEDAGVALGGEFLFEFLPEFLFCFRVSGIIGEIVHAVGVVFHIEEFFFWSFAEGHLVEAVFGVFGGEAGEIGFGGGSVAVEEAVLGVAAGPAMWFEVPHIEKVVVAEGAHGVGHRKEVTIGASDIVAFFAEESVIAFGVDAAGIRCEELGEK